MIYLNMKKLHARAEEKKINPGLALEWTLNSKISNFKKICSALTYAKVILTKLEGVQNSSSFVLYILEN